MKKDKYICTQLCMMYVCTLSFLTKIIYVVWTYVCTQARELTLYANMICVVCADKMLISVTQIPYRFCLTCSISVHVFYSVTSEKKSSCTFEHMSSVTEFIWYFLSNVIIPSFLILHLWSQIITSFPAESTVAVPYTVSNIDLDSRF